MFVPTRKAVMPPLQRGPFLVRVVALFVLTLAALLFFHLANGRPLGSSASESLVQTAMLVAATTIFSLWQRRDRYQDAPAELSMEQRVQALAASRRGPVPADQAVRHEALRLARLSYEAAVKGIAAQAVLSIGALLLAVLALLTSPWWWGDAAVAAVLAVLLALDLRHARGRTSLLTAASRE